jgi:hypothetical protein
MPRRLLKWRGGGLVAFLGFNATNESTHVIIIVLTVKGERVNVSRCASSAAALSLMLRGI